MKVSEIRNLSVGEQQKKVEDLKEELMNLRFQNAIGQLENNRKLVEVKKDIARVKTIINEAAKA